MIKSCSTYAKLPSQDLDPPNRFHSGRENREFLETLVSIAGDTSAAPIIDTGRCNSSERRERVGLSWLRSRRRRCKMKKDPECLLASLTWSILAGEVSGDSWSGFLLFGELSRESETTEFAALTRRSMRVRRT